MLAGLHIPIYTLCYSFKCAFVYNCHHQPWPLLLKSVSLIWNFCKCDLGDVNIKVSSSVQIHFCVRQKYMTGVTCRGWTLRSYRTSKAFFRWLSVSCEWHRPVRQGPRDSGQPYWRWSGVNPGTSSNILSFYRKQRNPRQQSLFQNQMSVKVRSFRRSLF